MLEASRRCVETHRKAAEGSTEKRLFTVAHAFFQLQEKRHVADYDLSRTLQDTEVALDIFLAHDAFDSWRKIQNQQISQDYLFSLLFKDKS